MPILGDVNVLFVKVCVPVSVTRSEERRVGKEGRARWSRYHYKKKKNNTQHTVG